ncbi:GNAT family N-acetyltransferase [Flavobacterium silvisoli]|uniref:GNAT family N-acetyltransferase n=1 Tax=Flavobacterium silvisoli TaxID=2529433 RepID=A0A4Q9YVJ2_9FLAO|nr:GNAT family N-acetyltransferase [Flavobacterium silvisoli]TBX67564.1 GNAT family N-acetyltransferase [Flavobacterium silvisoli]
MITIQTLANTDINTILNTFNLAFSDYVVPMRITEEQLINKMKTENIRLEYSVGAFNQNELIAFILHGQDTLNGKSIVYNGGTGVIPQQRGQKLTAQLYEFILPKLKAEQIDSVLLEVITTNMPAVTTYEKIGFKTLRTLDCFKGNIIQQPINQAYEIKELKNWDWNQLSSFWDWAPTSQNGISAVEINQAYLISLGIYQNEELCGYLIFNPKSNRIQQFAVAKTHRNKGLASQLFGYIAQNYTAEVSMINIDHASATTLSFLQNIGFEKTVSQYEMELKL